MESQAAPNDGRIFLDSSTPAGGELLSQARSVHVNGSILLAKTLAYVDVKEIFCQKAITNTDLVTTLDTHCIRIIAFPSFGSVLSAAASQASCTSRPSIILSADSHSYNLKFIVPSNSSQPVPIVATRLTLCKTAIKIDDIPGMLVYVLHKAMSCGLEADLNILSDALCQTVSESKADHLVYGPSVMDCPDIAYYNVVYSFAPHLLSRNAETSHFALNHTHNNLTVAAPFHFYPITHNDIPSRYLTAHRSATGADVGGLQVLSIAAPFQEIGVSLPDHALNSAGLKSLYKTEETKSSGWGDSSASSSTSQTALNSVQLGNPTVPDPFHSQQNTHSNQQIPQAAACGYAAVQMPFFQRCNNPALPTCNRDFLAAGATTITGGPNSTNNLRCFHNASLWFQRRNNQIARIPEAVEQVLYKEDVFWKQGVPLAGLAVSVMGVCQPDSLTALKSLLPCVFFLMLGSIVCTFVGHLLKTTAPKASVSAMVLSKALVLTSFFTPILHLLPYGTAWHWVVYLMIAVLGFTLLFTVGYSLWKADVREPQEIEIDDMV